MVPCAIAHRSVLLSWNFRLFLRFFGRESGVKLGLRRLEGPLEVITNNYYCGPILLI